MYTLLKKLKNTWLFTIGSVLVLVACQLLHAGDSGKRPPFTHVSGVSGSLPASTFLRDVLAARARTLGTNLQHHDDDIGGASPRSLGVLVRAHSPGQTMRLGRIPLGDEDSLSDDAIEGDGDTALLLGLRYRAGEQLSEAFNRSPAVGSTRERSRFLHDAFHGHAPHHPLDDTDTRVFDQVWGAGGSAPSVSTGAPVSGIHTRHDLKPDGTPWATTTTSTTTTTSAVSRAFSVSSAGGSTINVSAHGSSGTRTSTTTAGVAIAKFFSVLRNEITIEQLVHKINELINAGRYSEATKLLKPMRSLPSDFDILKIHDVITAPRQLDGGPSDPIEYEAAPELLQTLIEKCSPKQISELLSKSLSSEAENNCVVTPVIDPLFLSYIPYIDNEDCKQGLQKLIKNIYKIECKFLIGTEPVPLVPSRSNEYNQLMLAICYQSSMIGREETMEHVRTHTRLYFNMLRARPDDKRIVTYLRSQIELLLRAVVPLTENELNSLKEKIENTAACLQFSQLIDEITKTYQETLTNIKTVTDLPKDISRIIIQYVQWKLGVPDISNHPQPCYCPML